MQILTGWKHRPMIEQVGMMIMVCVCLVFSCSAFAQIGSSAKRAAARAAATATERQVPGHTVKNTANLALHGAANPAKDSVVKRWTSSLCKRTLPCPLDEKTANTFKGGSYTEKVLGSDTVLYRTYHSPNRKFGDPQAQFSYWSRSNSIGTKSVVDSAIEVSRYGNIADRLVAIKVPKGTRIYEGKTQSIPKGPIGGGNQIVLPNIRSEWEVKVIDK